MPATPGGKIKDGKEITKEDVDRLTFPENLEDDAMMVPVDMRGVESEFEDVEEMVEKLGAKGAAEGFIKARDYFEKNNKDEEQKPMTAKDWRAVLEEDAMGDELFDEGLMEGEEEEMYDEDLEEEVGDEDADDGEAEEPAAKKAKTD